MSQQRYFKLTIAYDGTKYCGWQLQKNSISIHEVLMRAGQGFLPEGFTITGGSRTDSGVHALGYVALLKTCYTQEAKRLCRSFNAYLPKDIVVYQSDEVDKEFHPRYSATGKHYRYTIYNSCFPIPQFMHYSYYYSRHNLNAETMNKAAEKLVGKHDFITFSSKKTSVVDTVRTLYSCSVHREKDIVYIDVKGDGFLYNMVRIIAGMLIEVGRGKIEPEEIEKILYERDRMKATKTAPSQGLTLMEIYYS